MTNIVGSPGHVEVVGRLGAVTLDELNDAAALLRRVDRKYIVDDGQLAALIDVLSPRLAALDIDGRRSFAYESVYFDTPELDCFQDAAHRRRHRCKVRTRTYLDTATSMLEVKRRGVRDVTIKQRRSHLFDERSTLNHEAAAFVDGTLDRPGWARTLVPTLTTCYRRTTLVDLDDVARVTVDAELECTDRAGRSVALDGEYVLETKSNGHPSATDRQLWAMGIRPETISKFATGLAALQPELPSNKWHRTLRRHFSEPVLIEF